MELSKRPTLNLSPLPKRQIGVERRIVECDRCELHTVCTHPVPLSNPGNAQFIILNEMPNTTEDTRGRLGLGFHNITLSTYLKGAGLDPNTAGWMNVVSCFANVDRSPITPRSDHIAQCRGNFLAQRATLNSRFILIIGAVALGYFRSDLRITRVHGRVFTWDDTWIVMPVYHPGTLHKDPVRQHEMREDLTRFKNIIKGVKPYTRITEKCVECDSIHDSYDPDMVPYCEIHWPKGSKLWKKERGKWDKKHAKGSQQSLELDPI